MKAGFETARPAFFGETKMPQMKEWTLAEVGELIAGVQLLRTPVELSSALGRTLEEIEEKIMELGLAKTYAPRVT
jgi:hypothetical protein